MHICMCVLKPSSASVRYLKKKWTVKQNTRPLGEYVKWLDGDYGLVFPQLHRKCPLVMSAFVNHVSNN